MSAPADLSVFLRHVAFAYPILGTAQALSRVTREAVEDAASDGSRFLELRAGPSTHVRPDLPLEAVVEALCAGLQEGVATTGMPAALVLAMLREFDEDASVCVSEVAVRYRDMGVAAVDLAGDELRFPDLSRYAGAFRVAEEGGLGATAHAGEAGPAAAIGEAHRLLGVNRIGHGTRVGGDPEMLAWAADTGLCFEVCPTSNVLTGSAESLEAHPLKRMLQAGCRVVLGDDDPVVTGSPLSREQEIVTHCMGLSPTEVQSMSSTAVEVAFCDEVTRATLRDP